MSSLYFDDNAFDLLSGVRADVDVTELVSKAEAMAKKKKKQQQKLQKQLANNGSVVSDRDFATTKNVIVVYSDETDEKDEEKKTVSCFDDNREINGKIVAQERVDELKKEKERNDDFVTDLEDKKRDLKNKKKKAKKNKLNLKEEAKAAAETEKTKEIPEEVEGSSGILRGFFMVLHKAVTVVTFMALGAVMYSTWMEP